MALRTDKFISASENKEVNETALSAVKLFEEGQSVYKRIPRLTDLYGKGRPLMAEALKLFEQAANLGHLQAMYEFSTLAINNYSYSKPLIEKAVVFLKKAAHEGHLEAWYHLFRYYNEGRPRYGIPKDHQQAQLILKGIQNKEIRWSDAIRSKINAYLKSHCDFTDIQFQPNGDVISYVSVHPASFFSDSGVAVVMDASIHHPASIVNQVITLPEAPGGPR